MNHSGKRNPGFPLLLLMVVLVILYSIPVLGETACEHRWVLRSSTPPSCTAAGQELYVCDLCGAERAEITPALGHEWSVCTVIEAATCTQPGKTRCFCSRDSSHYIDKALPATGHEWSGWNVVKPATLTAPGLSERVCARCGDTEQSLITVKSHRERIALSLVMIPALASSSMQQGAEADDHPLEFEGALINTGETDLRITSFLVNGKEEPLPFDGVLLLPAGQLKMFYVTAENLQKPDARRTESTGSNVFYFLANTESGEQTSSNKVKLTGRVSIAPEDMPSAAPGIQVSQAIQPGSPVSVQYSLNDTVQYSVSVCNQSEEVFEQLKLIRDGSGDIQTLRDLQPGETRIVSLQYQITEQDVNNGYAFWTYSVQAEQNDKTKQMSFHSNLLVVPVTVR